MANKNLFQSRQGKRAPGTNATNEAGGRAYAFAPEHALAQYAVTGTLNQTFYASAEQQLDSVIELATKVDARFIAQLAIYTREKGFMKDMPALLCAILAGRDPLLLQAVFPRVIDNARMLRNYTQIMRSGVTGRRSLGSVSKRMIQNWINSRSSDALFRDSVGQAPSLADIIKMVHPRPANAERDALYGYLIGRDAKSEDLPELVRQFEAYKAGESKEVPDVPFRKLTALDLGTREWTEIARRAPWQMTRMNLNTFARHGVFKNKKMIKLVADRLRNEKDISRARVFPYQLMTAFRNVSADLPSEIANALQVAMEIATRNVPKIKGKVVICVDVSGSMGSPVTGHREGSTSKVRCVDVAGLVAASILRKNEDAIVMPFESHVVKKVRLNARDSVMTNANKLAELWGGGTNCSAPMIELNLKKARADLVFYVSDNESWMDVQNRWGSGTRTMQEWEAFKARNPKARMVCLDIQPYGTSQVKEREDILNIGGFSDQVFEVVSEFARGRLNSRHWVAQIEATRFD